MSTDISQQDIIAIRAALNRGVWQPKKSFIQVMLVSAMMSLIMFSFGYILFDIISNTMLASAGVLSILTMIGISLQIYSYASDSRTCNHLLDHHK